MVPTDQTSSGADATTALRESSDEAPGICGICSSCQEPPTNRWANENENSPLFSGRPAPAPTAQTSPVPATATDRSVGSYPTPSAVGTRFHCWPSQCSARRRKPPFTSRFQPTAQASVADSASTAVSAESP